MRNIFGTEAPAYWARGLAVIPLKTGDEGKRPALNRWQQWHDTLPSDSTQRAWLSRHEQGNIGLVLGPQSGVVALDIDQDNLVPEIRAMLREAGVDDLPWERKGKKGVVWLFKWREGLKSFSVPGCIDFLGQGRQVVLPPSIHPDTRAPYIENVPLLSVLDHLPEWPEGFERVLRRKYQAGAGGSGGVDIDNLPQRVRKGGRDVMATAVAGAFARAMLDGQRDADAAEYELGEWLWRALENPADDPIDAEKYKTRMWEFFRRDCEAAANSGHLPAYGWRGALTRAKLIDRDVSDLPEGDALPYVARRYILDCSTGVLVDSETGEIQEVAVIARRYAPHLKLPGKRYDLFAVELAQREELRRVDRIRFRPKATPGLIDEQGRPVWNTWRGYVHNDLIGEAVDSRVQPLLDMVGAMFPNSMEAEHLLDWMAHVVQEPGEKINWAPLIISEAGCVSEVVEI